MSKMSDESLEKIAVMSHCMEGRFKLGEACRTTTAVLRSLLESCQVFLGQACHVSKKHLLDLPDNFRVLGSSEAFVAYDAKNFKGEEHLWSPQSSIEGDLWHCVVRLKYVKDPKVEFFVVSSYVREHSSNPRKSALLFKHVLQLLQLLSRQFPVIVAGNFQLSCEEGNYLIEREKKLFDRESEFLDGIQCTSHETMSVRRKTRSCGFFMATHNLLNFVPTPSIESFLAGGNPVVFRSIRGNVLLNNSMDDVWRNPEDSFFWDPNCFKVKVDSIRLVVREMRKGSTTSTPSDEEFRRSDQNIHLSSTIYNNSNNMIINDNNKLVLNSNNLSFNNNDIDDSMPDTTPNTDQGGILNNNTSEYEFDDSEVDNVGHLKRSGVGCDVEEAYAKYLTIVKEDSSQQGNLKQIEKLKELRGVVDSVQQKNEDKEWKDEDTKSEQDKKQNGDLNEIQDNKKNERIPEMVSLAPEVENEDENVNKSLSTISEFDESIPECGGVQPHYDAQNGYDEDDDEQDGGSDDNDGEEYNTNEGDIDDKA